MKLVHVDLDIDEEGVTTQVARMLLERLTTRDNAYLSLDELVSQITEDEIRSRVIPLIEIALMEPRQPTDQWGNVKGEPLTMAEHINTVIHEFLTKESGDYNRRETAVKKFIREEVEKAVKADLTTSMNAAREQVQAAVKEQAATILAQTIERMASIH